MANVNDFVKLYGEGKDQILFVKQNNEDGEPGITIFVKPTHEFLDVCSTALGFGSGDDAAKNRDIAWESINKKQAIQMRVKLHKEFAKF